MILCFSGNGNTLAVGKLLSAELGEDMVPLRGKLLRGTAALSIAEGTARVIWAFPVYCWGVPPAVLQFVRRLQSDIFPKDALHYLVLTCGDDVGRTPQSWRRLMAEKGWLAASTFSVQMPNTYTLLPGFDVDSPELVARKLEAMPARVEAVASAIRQGTVGVDDVVPGAMPRLKSAIYPLWARFDIHPGKFKVSDACIHCGKCARACPTGCVTMRDGNPRWLDGCTQCLACYNVCPVRAIDYGARTRGKGQYFCRENVEK